jgi:hypothetical protein
MNRRADGHGFPFVGPGIIERDFAVGHLAGPQIVTDKAILNGWVRRIRPSVKFKVKRTGVAIPNHVFAREMPKLAARKLSFVCPVQIFQDAF